MELYSTMSDALLALARSAWDGSWSTSLAGFKTRLADLSSNAGFLTGVSIAEIAAAAVSAVLVSFIFIARARKLALKAPAPVPEAAAPVASVAPTGALRTRWQAVMARMESPHEADWKLAVIDADKLVDDALARSGYAGDSFGDRLMNIDAGALASLDGLWWAHKVRNRLAHEMDYFLRYTEARQAMGYYEQTLQELNLV